MRPDPERLPLRPEPQRAPAAPAPAPKVQRLAPREPDARPLEERPPVLKPVRPAIPDAPIVTPPRTGGLFGRNGRVAALALLLVAGGMLIGGSDGKVNSPPPAAVMSESIPDEIVVDLKDNATDAQIADLQQSLGVTLRYNSIHSVASKLMVGRVAPADRDQILSRLRANTLVEAAEPEFLYHTDQAAAPAPVSSPAVKGKTFVPNDPDYPRQWHLKLIGMEEAWTRTRGKGATVAVIDTGMGAMSQTGLVEPQDFDQSQLLKGFNFTNNQDLAPDDIGHGTHVTATIAESTDNGVMGAGIAPEAKIMPLRVADAHGMATLANLADAIRYASDHGADVVNLSMSGANYSQIMETAIKDGYKRNVTFVCAAGNSGQEGVEYPAKYQECIGVSAVGPGNLFAYYSTFGKEVDLAAPGGNPRQGEAAMVWQDSIMQKSGFFGPYGPRIDALFPMGGTSSSAPHVAGVAALLVSLGMKDPKEIRSQLRKSAQKYAPADHYGAGVLNAAEAVRTVQKSNRETWIQIGIIVGAAALLLTIGRTLQKPADPLYFVHRLAIALAAGMFLPIVIEKVAGFGSLWNLVGHSVILAVVLLSMPKLGRAGFWQAVAFTAGLMLHLLLDADSGRAPFQVLPQQRILFWLYANVAVGLYFAASAFRASRRNEQQGVRA